MTSPGENARSADVVTNIANANMDANRPHTNDVTMSNSRVKTISHDPIQLKLLTVPQRGRRDWKEQFAAIKKAVAAVKGSDGH